MKKLFKDILTEPNSNFFSFILVLGLFSFFYANIMEAIEFCITGHFDLKEYYEGSAVFLTTVGGVYVVQYGIDKFKNTRSISNSE